MSRINMPAGLVLMKLSSWLTDGHFLAVCSQDLYSVHVERGRDSWCLILVIKGHCSYWIGPHPSDSFNLNYLPEGPIPKFSKI